MRKKHGSRVYINTCVVLAKTICFDTPVLAVKVVDTVLAPTRLYQTKRKMLWSINPIHLLFRLPFHLGCHWVWSRTYS